MILFGDNRGYVFLRRMTSVVRLLIIWAVVSSISHSDCSIFGAVARTFYNERKYWNEKASKPVVDDFFIGRYD